MDLQPTLRHRFGTMKGADALRVADVKLFRSIATDNRKGLPESAHIKTPEETVKAAGAISLTSWLAKLKVKLIKDGVDTVFKILTRWKIWK